MASTNTWNCCQCNSIVNETWAAFKNVAYRCKKCIKSQNYSEIVRKRTAILDDEDLPLVRFKKEKISVTEKVVRCDLSNISPSESKIEAKQDNNDRQNCTVNLVKLHVPIEAQVGSKTIENEIDPRIEVAQEISITNITTVDTLNQQEAHIMENEEQEYARSCSNCIEIPVPTKNVEDKMESYKQEVLSKFDCELVTVNKAFDSLDQKTKAYKSEGDNLKAQLKHCNKTNNRKINNLSKKNKQLVQQINDTSRDNNQLKEQKENLVKTTKDALVRQDYENFSFVPEGTFDPLSDNYVYIDLDRDIFPKEIDSQHDIDSQKKFHNYIYGDEKIDSSKQICIAKLKEFQKNYEDQSTKLNQMVDEIQYFIKTTEDRCNEIEHLIEFFKEN